MAYSTGSYTGVGGGLSATKALDLFAAWAVTNGWTQNNLSTDGVGKRLHIQKAIGGTDFFFNFRSTLDTDTVFPMSAFDGNGILVNGSTAWDGLGTIWNEQTGHTTQGYLSATAIQGGVRALKLGGGTYHFFATPTNLTAVFETDSDELDWRMLTVGSLGGYPAYFSSSNTHYHAYVSGSYDSDSAYGAVTSSVGDKQSRAAVYVTGEGWYVSHNSVGFSGTRSMHNIVDGTSNVSDGIYGSMSAAIIAHSPDSFRGNAQLAPSTVTIKKGLYSEVWPVADIEGVKFINMKNYTNGQEITYDGDTYKLFRIFNSSDTGVAFLK